MQQANDQSPRLIRCLGEIQFTRTITRDRTEDTRFIGIDISEGSASFEHLKQHDSHRPDIDSVVISLLRNDLWSEVQRIAADSHAIRAIHDFGEAKVDQLQQNLKQKKRRL